MAKDYYSILGVSRNVSVAEIKKGYRKLARKHHPDLNPGDKNSEARFKEIQEAYSVLSDPKKKAQYDQFGSVRDVPPGGPYQQSYSSGGFEGFNFSDAGSSSFRDFFDNIFSSSQRQAYQGPQKGEDLRYTMKVGFFDAINGIQTRIQLARMAACGSCGGQGYIQVGGSKACPACGGTGKTTTPVGTMRFATACQACGGTGKAAGTECRVCHGRGQIQKTELIRVRIPAGVDSGSKVRIPGKGNAGNMGGPPGDLLIIIGVDSHKLFRREGTNIHIKVPITVPEATLGAKIEVPTIHGKSTIRIPPATKSGQKFRLRDKGVPKVKKKSRGDQFVEVYIVPPPFHDQRIREIMEELEKASDVNPRENLVVN